MCLQPRGGPRPGRRTSCSESLLADPHVWIWGLEIGCFLSFSWLSFLKLAGSFWSTARCGNHSLNKQKKLMRFRGQLSGQKRIVPGGESSALRGVPLRRCREAKDKAPVGDLVPRVICVALRVAPLPTRKGHRPICRRSPYTSPRASLLRQFFASQRKRHPIFTETCP